MITSNNYDSEKGHFT